MNLRRKAITIDTVLFDLDGTIVDTNDLIIGTFLHVLEGLTPEPLSKDYIGANMGRPLLEQLRMFSGLTEVDHLVDLYRKYNRSKHDELVKEFPYVREVLAKLHSRGIKMGVVTSKVRISTEMGLKLCSLDQYVSTVITVEDVEHPKPHPEPVQKALMDLGADAGRTLMVGDSQFDIEAAQQAGVMSAGVSWSLKGEDFLRQFNPDFMIKDMRELLEIVGLERDAD